MPKVQWKPIRTLMIAVIIIAMLTALMYYLIHLQRQPEGRYEVYTGQETRVL